MFKNFWFACLVLPLFADATSNAVISTYVSVPPSSAVVKKNIDDLKKEIESLNNAKTQKIYDHLNSKKKEITDKNLLEIYYVVISFLRVQPNVASDQELKKKVNSLLNRLNWLYSDHNNEKFSEKVANLGKLLKPEFFIHLNVQKMSECLDMAQNLKSVVEYSSLGNDLSPEDGPDYFSLDFFLKKEIETAQQIYSQVVELENVSQDFSKNCATLSKEQLIDNLKKANNFINKLKFVTINVGDNKTKISRNIRKHLQNLASSSIEKLTEQKNQFEE
ncbi:MAG: hypothetical protein J5821_00705 [Alphaproteobacteria bacterium]|nr:hypothetical protein [Alphaproteobacteria bacterium]